MAVPVIPPDAWSSALPSLETTIEPEPFRAAAEPLAPRFPSVLTVDVTDLADGSAATKCLPDFGKGYYRMAQALVELGRLREARLGLPVYREAARLASTVAAHAVTLVSQYPFRHIQVVLRLYSSPAEVLCGFDVDSCACGYDGERAYFCQRTALAFASQANSVDVSRRSPSYEMRLAKYAERGFEVRARRARRA